MYNKNTGKTFKVDKQALNDINERLDSLLQEMINKYENDIVAEFYLCVFNLTEQLKGDLEELNIEAEISPEQKLLNSKMN